MATGNRTHWIAALAVVAGLLFMRLPTFACQCQGVGCCAMALQSPEPPSADQHKSCCAGASASKCSEHAPTKPRPSNAPGDERTSCDCGCTLCKTTSPTPLHDPTMIELRELPVGQTLEFPLAAAPDADRIVLLRPPRS